MYYGSRDTAAYLLLFLKYNHLDCDKTFPLTLVHPTFVASFFCSYFQFSLFFTHLVAITRYRDCCSHSARFLINTLHSNTYFTFDSSRCITTNSSTPPFITKLIYMFEHCYGIGFWWAAKSKMTPKIPHEFPRGCRIPKFPMVWYYEVALRILALSNLTLI